MSLTIKHLNDDASFLLTFRSSSTKEQETSSRHEFSIVLDPWLGGESTTFHSKFSLSRPKKEPCIASLSEIPQPDLVIISQDKSDHCHAATLKTLPKSSRKTTILAEPVAARIIRAWKHFQPEMVRTMPKYDERKHESIHRIALPPLCGQGTPGEVTVSFVAQKLDVAALHSAVCITYRAPTNFPVNQSTRNGLLTPPTSPPLDALASYESMTPKTLSVIFSPHGLAYSSLRPLVESHLLPRSALPLTALLHCFDRIDNPWYLGGNICAGMPGGVEIAQQLCAKAWISAHDGDKVNSGMATTRTVTTKYGSEEIENAFGGHTAVTNTRVMLLKSGEEIEMC